MKTQELVSLDNLGNAITTTLLVAEVLGKNHRDVFNEVTRLLEEEKNEYEADSKTAQEGELWGFFRKRSFTDSQGKTQDIYEITRDGLEILTYSYKDKEALIKELFLREFSKLDPPVFWCNHEVLSEDKVEAILEIFDSNHEDDRLLKKATLNELNKRASIIALQSEEILELQKKLDFYNAKTLLDHVN